MLATLLVAPAWFWLYTGGARLLPVIASHLLLAVVIRFAVASHIHFDLNVGARGMKELREVFWLKEHDLWARVGEYSSPAYFDSKDCDYRRFIQGLYLDILHREADEDEVQKWVEDRDHRTRKDVVIWFFTRHEYAELNSIEEP